MKKTFFIILAVLLLVLVAAYFIYNSSTMKGVLKKKEDKNALDKFFDKINEAAGQDPGTVKSGDIEYKVDQGGTGVSNPPPAPPSPPSIPGYILSGEDANNWFYKATANFMQPQLKVIPKNP